MSLLLEHPRRKHFVISDWICVVFCVLHWHISSQRLHKVLVHVQTRYRHQTTTLCKAKRSKKDGQPKDPKAEEVQAGK